MSARTLMMALAARGVHLEARGDRLHYRAPRGVLTAADRAALATHKAELLAALVEPRPPLPRGFTHWCAGAHPFPTPLPPKVARCSRCMAPWRRPAAQSAGCPG